MTSELVTLDEIRVATDRIRGVAVRTPLLPCLWADGPQPLYLKPESLQATGAFKVRGAVNKLATLTETERAKGVVTHSSGNHGQAVAYTARRTGTRAVVVMPHGVPEVKRAATEALGAEVVLVEPGDRLAATERIAEERGMVVVPPYDDRHVIAGQGTIGVEILADLPDVAAVLVPVSGGGLIAGVATAVKSLDRSVRVIGVEPELAADTAESLRAGSLVNWDTERRFRTIADSLRMQPSELTWQHIRTYVDDVITVTEQDIRAAMRVLALRGRLTAEPGGAVATAARLFHGDELPQDGPSVAVLSGGNVDPALFAEVLRG